jgi:hypothetical protein
MRTVLYDGLSFVTEDGELELTPSAHFRLTIPGDALRRAGHEVFTARTLTFDTETGRLAGILTNGERITGADVVLIKAGMTAALTLVWNAQTARRNGQVIVHDLCDWPVIIDHRHPLVRVGWIGVHKLCDAIFVNTEYLSRQLGEMLGRPSYFIPSALDLTAWDGVEPEDVRDGPILGWHGVPFFRQPDLALFRGWLRPFMERHDLRLIHAGRTVFDNPQWNIDFASVAGIDPERVEVRDGVPAAKFPTSGLLNGVDIGLAPMADTAISKSRTPNKVFDYVHRGIPYVASPSEPYKALRTGRLAGSSLADQSPAAWQAELERLLDPEERVALARANAEVIDWDIRERAGDWESALQELVDRKIGNHPLPVGASGQGGPS